MAVSDAAMLAPEEVFTGKGDIKEEAELTQAERKRRRANKKRKFKGNFTISSCFILEVRQRLIKYIAHIYSGQLNRTWRINPTLTDVSRQSKINLL